MGEPAAARSLPPLEPPLLLDPLSPVRAPQPSAPQGKFDAEV